MHSNWAKDVFDLLKDRNIGLVATVPDTGLSDLLNLCHGDADTTVITLSSEQEGIGLLFGHWLGGQRGALLMQGSGAGNCINALSLPAATRTPCLMLVTMRGQWGEYNPWQVHMGQAVRPTFEAMGVKCFPVTAAEDVGETFAAAADLAFNGGFAAAVLIHQRVLGVKTFEE